MTPANREKPPLLTRRRFLWAGAGATVAVAAAGTGTYQIGTPWVVQRWVMGVVRDNLPGVAINKASLEQFARDALNHPELLRRKQRRILVWVATTMPALARRIDGLARRADVLERRVLSEFLLSSDFFSMGENRTEPVTYTGRVAACGNVFARFREA